MKVTYYAGASLDGFIAKEDGDISWLEVFNTFENSYDEFYESVDAIIMGKKTYEMIVSFGTWPYDNKPTWVLSSSEVTAMQGCNLQMQVAPQEAVHIAAKTGMKHMWVVGGGVLATSMINKKLVTNISVTQLPIMLGRGIKLFGDLEKDINLKLKKSEVFSDTLVQLDYEIK